MSAELILLLVALPFAFWAAFQDLSRMKLPNWMTIAIAVVFILLGPFLFPLEDYLWRIGIGVSVFVVVLILSLVVEIGGGDIKYTAAVLPWIPMPLMPVFVVILAGAVLIGFVMHRIARRQRWIRAMAPRWVSWRRQRYPMGLSISVAWLLTLAAAALNVQVGAG